MTPPAFRLNFCLLSRADNLPHFDAILIQFSPLPVHTLLPNQPEQCVLSRARCSIPYLQALENGTPILPTLWNAPELFFFFLTTLASIYPLLLVKIPPSIDICFWDKCCPISCIYVYHILRHDVTGSYLPDLMLVELEGRFKILGLIFWLHHLACGILVPRPGMEATPAAGEAQSPNH